MSIPKRPDNVLIAMSQGRVASHFDLEPLISSPDGKHDFPPEILKMLEQLEGDGLVERVDDRWKLTPAGVKRRTEVEPPPTIHPMDRQRSTTHG